LASAPALGAGGREFKSPRPDHFFFRLLFGIGIFHALFTGYPQLIVSGENFVACAKGNRNVIEQISTKNLILRQPIVKQAFC
jgi:hypothetical protein